jgi:hypothetical protein
MIHEMTPVKVDGKYRYQCVGCGWSTAAFKEVSDAEARSHIHDENHYRAIKALHHNPTPQLKHVHAHYAAQAENPSLSEEERAQWRALADELARRLGLGEVKTEQDQLF